VPARVCVRARTGRRQTGLPDAPLASTTRACYHNPVQSQQRVKTYHRIKLLCSLAHTLLFLVYALAGCFVASPVVESLAPMIGGRWLLLLVFAFLFLGLFELIALPLDFYSSFRLEHRFDLSNETVKGWMVNQLKTWAVGGVIGAAVVVGMYGLLWYGGAFWFLWALGAWLGLVVLLAQLFPIVLLPIFYKSTLITDESLVARLERLADGTGITLRGIFDLNLSKDTKKANAMLAGLGKTRRVFLSDTLLEAFSHDEIDVVFAHELAHHVRKHIWKLLGITVLTSTAMVVLIAWRLDSHHGPAAAAPAGVAALPQVFLVVTLFQLLLQPVTNAVNRRFEVQSDTDALTRTQNPTAYRSAFAKLGDMNLADPSPHPFIEWFFYDHPAMAKRLALADGYIPPTADRAASGSLREHPLSNSPPRTTSATPSRRPASADDAPGKPGG